MKKFLVCFVLAGMIGAAWADDEDNNNNNSIKIDRINFAKGELVLNDHFYMMDPNMEVKGKNGSSLSRSNLKEGQKVLVELSPYRVGKYSQVKTIVVQSDQ